MSLPKAFVESGLKLSDGMTLMGQPLASLNRDELIAAAAHGWNAEGKAREECRNHTAFLFDIMGTR